MNPKTLSCLMVLASVLVMLVGMPARAETTSGYPTMAIADYVFVCMKVNGETHDALQRCSCAIDVITSILPYEAFEKAETFRRMSRLTGDAGSVFRDNAKAKAAVDALRRAEIEGEVRCF